MEAFIGQIQLFPYGFSPVDWALCDGRTLRIAENQVLYSLLGSKFGGDGLTTFALPNMKSTTTDVNYFIALQGRYPSRT